MKKVLLIVVAALAVSLLAAGRAASDPPWAGECGVPAQQTVWGEYGWPTLLPILARPGTFLAVTNNPSDYAGQARKRGAATYSFDLKLKNKVGTPNAPADPSTIASAAETQYQKTIARSGGCTTPLIVENELFGAGSVTPWSTENAQYRADVLTFLRDLAGYGVHPVLLVARSPYLGSSEAVAWWLDVAKVASIVREDYVPATRVWQLGPVLGNRLLRQEYRQAVADFTSIGIPARKLGIMISVLSARGGGGRNGLQPDSAWYQVVKWYSLSAREVAREVGLGSVFSWGWQQWNPAEVDPTKRQAACVWLWSRRRSLCNAPHMLGRSFDTSLTEGQIVLPRGALCRTPGFGTVGSGEVARLAAVTGDRTAALSALFERLVESRHATVSNKLVLAAERTVVDESFNGSRPAYVAALKQAHASVLLARNALADELRRAQLEQMFHVAKPTSAEVADFYSTYQQLLVRRVTVSPKAPWLGNKKEGLALSGSAPAKLFTARSAHKAQVVTPLGTYTVKPSGPALPLGALSISTVRPAIVAALQSFERAQALQHWTISLQRGALGAAICRNDELPQPAEVDLTQALPFLQLR